MQDLAVKAMFAPFPLPGSALAPVSGGAIETPLPVLCTVDPAEPGVVLASIAVPETALDGASVVISAVTVAGLPVPSAALPARVCVSRGIQVPMLIKRAANSYTSTPAISLTGVLVAPDSLSCDCVPVFDADGSSLPSLDISNLGLPSESRVRSVSIAHPPGSLSEVLYLASGCNLLALDMDSRNVLWKFETDALEVLSMGLATLPTQGALIVSDYTNWRLHTHRLSDGSRMCTAHVGSKVSHVAADASTDMVFASTAARGVVAYTCDGGALATCDRFAAGGLSGSFIVLAVTPPSRGPDVAERPACLVACDFDSPLLFVYELPSCRHVFTSNLVGMRIVSLTADPRGRALAIGDAATSSIHVLPWPLPSFPSDMFDRAASSVGDGVAV